MKSSDSIRLIFAGGGTGGHLFPAIAIADRISEMLEGKVKTEIQFVGTKRGIEYRLQDKLGYKLNIINMRGIARSFTLKNLLVPFAVLSSLMKSNSLMRRFRPDLVIGTGGYVCYPVLKAAGWNKVPIVLQEQNTFPGVVTRQLAGSASKIYLGFKKASEYLNTNAELIESGNPVRPEMVRINREDALKSFDLDPSKKTILILGGSQGARAINQAILKSLKDENIKDNYQILWQTGKRDYKDVAVEAGEKVIPSALFPFSNNMAKVYSAADFVIARAGALTLAEILLYEIPSLLIPYPFAAGDHQRKNSEDMVHNKMAEMIDEKDLTDKKLLGIVTGLIESGHYEQMKDNLRNYNKDRKPAVDLIAEDIIALLGKLRGQELVVEESAAKRD